MRRGPAAAAAAWIATGLTAMQLQCNMHATNIKLYSNARTRVRTITTNEVGERNRGLPPRATRIQDQDSGRGQGGILDQDRR